MFLGDDLLPLLVLALGGALLIGNGLALLRPPPDPSEDELAKAPVARTAVMMIVGLVATIAALAKLTS